MTTCDHDYDHTEHTKENVHKHIYEHKQHIYTHTHTQWSYFDNFSMLDIPAHRNAQKEISYITRGGIKT